MVWLEDELLKKVQPFVNKFQFHYGLIRRMTAQEIVRMLIQISIPLWSD